MDRSKRRFCAHAPLALVALLVMRARAQTPADGARVIRIEAKKFVFTPNQIALRRGEAVVLELSAIDFTHGFNIPDLKLRADLMPGKLTRIRLQPMQAGELAFLCDNFCGAGHEEMNGVIRVLP